MKQPPPDLKPEELIAWALCQQADAMRRIADALDRVAYQIEEGAKPNDD